MGKINRLGERVFINGANKSMNSINSFCIGTLFIFVFFIMGTSALRAQNKGQVIASLQDTLMFDTTDAAILPIIEKHTIIGSIFSMEWKEYLPGAMVELKEDKKVFVMSDREGNFEIKIPEKYWKEGKVQLEVRFLGCETKTLTVHEQDKQPIRVTLFSQPLNEKSGITYKSTLKSAYDPIYER